MNAVSIQPVGVIGAKEKFYGYLIGLRVECFSGPSEDFASAMYATFEYNGKIEVFEVPDYALFEVLSKHLCNMAFEQSCCDNFGLDKLYIEMINHKWVVTLP